MHGQGHIVGVHLAEHFLWLASVSQFYLMAIDNWFFVFWPMITIYHRNAAFKIGQYLASHLFVDFVVHVK